LNTDANKLLKKHQQLNQTEMAKVTSHVQRNQDDWVLNTLMIDGCDVPFRYKRKKRYKNLTGQRVNLTYYPSSEIIADIDFEFMKVVRIKIT